MDFEEAWLAFWQELGAGRTMVLSTSLNDRVTSRMMSIVALEGRMYFQTDCALPKYEQLKGNPNVALCADNIQIEGRCEELGKPSADEAFCTAYQKCFPTSFTRYTFLPGERLFMVTPARVQRWRYLDGKPCVETFDVKNGRHSLAPYGAEG